MTPGFMLLSTNLTMFFIEQYNLKFSRYTVTKVIQKTRRLAAKLK